MGGVGSLRGLTPNMGNRGNQAVGETRYGVTKRQWGMGRTHVDRIRIRELLGNTVAGAGIITASGGRGDVFIGSG